MCGCVCMCVVKVELPLCPKWDNKGMGLVSALCNLYYYLSIYSKSSIFFFLCYSWSRCVTFGISVIRARSVHKDVRSCIGKKIWRSTKQSKFCFVQAGDLRGCGVCYDSSRFIITWQMELFTSHTAYRGHGSIKTDGLHFSHVPSHLPNRSGAGCQEQCRGGFHLHPG